MSDHPKEADRNLKRIFICNDIYLDLFNLLASEKVGLELALVSHRFDALVDTHFKSRKWTLGKLRIYPKNIVKTNDDWVWPFPPTPLPNSIVGFSSVSICVFNSDAIAFLRCIGRLLESNVCLELEIYKESTWNTFATSVWPLLNASAIIKMHFDCSTGLQTFRRLTSLFILRDCSNLRIITFYDDQILQFLPDDSKGSSEGQALSKWLHTPREDCQPKVLKFRFGEIETQMNALKTTFLSATTAVSFIIRLHVFSSSLSPFELVNWLTRERLTSRKICNESNLWLIERSPIDKNAKQWAKWEKEALDDLINEGKVLRIMCF